MCFPDYIFYFFTKGKSVHVNKTVPLSRAHNSEHSVPFSVTWKTQRLHWKKKLEEEEKKKREKKTCQYSCRQIVPSLSTWIWNLFPWRKWLSGKWRHGVLSCYCSVWEVLRNNNDNEFEKQHLCYCYNKIVINERQKSQTLKKAMG